MEEKLYDKIYEKLQMPIKIYLNNETKKLLEHDCESFDIKNKNLFYNTLVSNYIGDYVKHLENEGKQILEIMQDSIINGNKDDFPSIARKIAYKNATSEDIKEHGDYISLRINLKNIDLIADAIASTNENIKVSIFFRNLFLDYLSLPIYRREQIIYIDQYNKIIKAINEGLKISYWNKNKHKSHNLSVYSIKQSGLEYHNYVIGSRDNKPGASSIKLSSIGTVRLLNEKAAFNDTFKECYKVMKENGCQFGVDSIKYHKVYLTDEDIKTYNNRYLDRPIIYKNGVDEKGKFYIFNCSRFQLEGYFNPFKHLIEIEEIDDC